MPTRYFLLVSLLAFHLATSSEARAQLESTSPAQQRVANRKALRDAARFNARYKDSHLTVTKEELQHQGPGKQAVLAPPPGQDRFKFDRNGQPRVEEPVRPGWWKRRTRATAKAQ